MLSLLRPMAQPWVAGLVALVLYLVRASLSTTGLQATKVNYFNFLADAFLHGQPHLRLTPSHTLDLIYYGDKTYLYWPPFPAITLMPLVGLFGAQVSDTLFTVIFGAFTIALTARLLELLDTTGVAPLTVERRAILVVTVAFGTVLLILIPGAGAWNMAQVIGWGCVLLATIAALRVRGPWAYFLVGLALACALTTRVSLLFNGVWLAYYLLQRDWRLPWRRQALAVGCGAMPVFAALLLFGWYNYARFDNPFEMGLAWHNMGPIFLADYERYGLFNLHYLPKNLYYQFVAYNLFTPEQWHGGGLFWMTPVLMGALYALWNGRKSPLVWTLLLSCILVYIPIGLLMGTGYFTFGPRYLLDLMVPIVVLTALGIRRWRLDILQALMLISCVTYLLGSAMWRVAVG